MPGSISNCPLARDLIRIGGQAIARENDMKLRDYFTSNYVFHGPGADLGFEELRALLRLLARFLPRPATRP
jgi:hypothetical protein